MSTISSSAPAFIEGWGWGHELFQHLSLGDMNGRISTANIILTGGEGAHALSDFVFSAVENAAHAYIFSVGYVTASAHAYIEAIMRASAHAYIRGRTTINQSASAFIEGSIVTYKRASAHAYIQGNFTDLPGPLVWTT